MPISISVFVDVARQGNHIKSVFVPFPLGDDDEARAIWAIAFVESQMELKPPRVTASPDGKMCVTGWHGYHFHVRPAA